VESISRRSNHPAPRPPQKNAAEIECSNIPGLSLTISDTQYSNESSSGSLSQSPAPTEAITSQDTLAPFLREDSFESPAVYTFLPHFDCSPSFVERKLSHLKGHVIVPVHAMPMEYHAFIQEIRGNDFDLVCPFIWGNCPVPDNCCFVQTLKDFGRETLCAEQFRVRRTRVISVVSNMLAAGMKT
jgi:hypothetical protein